MKHFVRIGLALLALLLVLSMLFVACKQNQQTQKTDDKQTETPAEETPAETGLWKDATYLEDKTFGTGATEVTVVVTAEEKSITFTIKTDKEMLGEAMEEFDLIAKGSAGYYTIVNGMTADWDTDQSYWAFYIGSDYAATGVDSTPVTAGTQYALTYTK